MSKIKSLILGSAAVLAATAGAQAADLPVKAKAVQYVKICSLYGAGFYYIPGTDTCIKLGGYVQLDVNFNSNNYNNPLAGVSAGAEYTGGTGIPAGVSGTYGRESAYYTTRSRVQLNIDTRTATEYGVVRTYWGSNFEHSSGWGPSSGNLTVDLGFIQFAGFTFGKAISGFITPWSAYTGNVNTSAYIGGADNATGITQVAYTWQFGNGVSAQIGVEDNTVIQRAPVLNVMAPNAANGFGFGSATAWSPNAGGNFNQVGAGNTAAFTNDLPYGTRGVISPDIVGNIRVDQAAFTAQVSGALHSVAANHYNTSFDGTAAYAANESMGHPDDKWGWAISGGLLLKNLPTGAGDKWSVDVTYTEGAPKYVVGGTVGNSFSFFSGNNFAAGILLDGVYGSNFTGGVGNTSIELTKVWGVRSSFVHNWAPTVQSNLFGGYTHVDYSNNATAIINAGMTSAIKGGVVGGVFNPDFNIWQIGLNTAWTPVQNLTFSVEGLYTYIDQSNTGTVTATAPTAGTNAGGGATTTNTPGNYKGPGTYNFSDQGVFTGNFRVRRTF